MKKLIQNKIEELLSKEFYCGPKELSQKLTIYSINLDVKQPYIKILAYRNCVVVCTSANIHSKIKEILQDKTRDEIFELPLVYGQTIHYVPDDSYTKDISTSSNYKYECLFDRDILALTGLAGFENSLEFDENGCTAIFRSNRPKKTWGS